MQDSGNNAKNCLQKIGVIDKRCINHALKNYKNRREHTSCAAQQTVIILFL